MEIRHHIYIITQNVSKRKTFPQNHVSFEAHPALRLDGQHITTCRKPILQEMALVPFKRSPLKTEKVEDF